MAEIYHSGPEPLIYGIMVMYISHEQNLTLSAVAASMMAEAVFVADSEAHLTGVTVVMATSRCLRLPAV